MRPLTGVEFFAVLVAILLSPDFIEARLSFFGVLDLFDGRRDAASDELCPFVFHEIAEAIRHVLIETAQKDRADLGWK